jgi:RNase P subunit RPR2
MKQITNAKDFYHCKGYRIKIKIEGDYKRVYCGHCGALIWQEMMI